MGTDIHLQVQGKVGGSWEWVAIRPFPAYGSRDFSWDNDPMSRNYRLFALLADVRNGFAFAGVRTHSPVVAAFPHRGLPDGLTAEDCEYCDDHGDPARDFAGGDSWLGDHSFTHATLRELRAVDYDTRFRDSGVVDADGFREWRASGVPSGWSADVWGRDVVVTADIGLFERVIGGDPTAVDGEGRTPTHCRVRWEWAPLVDCAFRRWLDSPAMQQIEAHYGGPDNVRILIGFDS